MPGSLVTHRCYEEDLDTDARSGAAGQFYYVYRLGPDRPRRQSAARASCERGRTYFAKGDTARTRSSRRKMPSQMSVANVTGRSTAESGSPWRTWIETAPPR